MAMTPIPADLFNVGDKVTKVRWDYSKLTSMEEGVVVKKTKTRVTVDFGSGGGTIQFKAGWGIGQSSRYVKDDPHLDVWGTGTFYGGATTRLYMSDASRLDGVREEARRVMAERKVRNAAHAMGREGTVNAETVAAMRVALDHWEKVNPSA